MIPVFFTWFTGVLSGAWTWANEKAEDAWQIAEGAFNVYWALVEGGATRLFQHLQLRWQQRFWILAGAVVITAAVVTLGLIATSAAEPEYVMETYTVQQQVRDDAGRIIRDAQGQPVIRPVMQGERPMLDQHLAPIKRPGTGFPRFAAVLIWAAFILAMAACARVAVEVWAVATAANLLANAVEEPILALYHLGRDILVRVGILKWVGDRVQFVDFHLWEWRARVVALLPTVCANVVFLWWGVKLYLWDVPGSTELIALNSVVGVLALSAILGFMGTMLHTLRRTFMVALVAVLATGLGLTVARATGIMGISDADAGSLRFWLAAHPWAAAIMVGGLAVFVLGLLGRTWDGASQGSSITGNPFRAFFWIGFLAVVVFGTITAGTWVWHARPWRAVVEQADERDVVDQQMARPQPPPPAATPAAPFRPYVPAPPPPPPPGRVNPRDGRAQNSQGRGGQHRDARALRELDAIRL